MDAERLDHPVPRSLTANFSEARPISVSEQGSFFVLALHDGRFIKVSEDVKRVLDALMAEGAARSFADVASQVHRDGGAELREEEVRDLVERVLLPQGIVLDTAVPTPSRAVRRGSRLWVHLRLFDGRKLAGMARFTVFLFTRNALLSVAGSWLAATLLLFVAGAPKVLMSEQSYRFALVDFLLLVLPGAVFHELGHALSCYRFGVQAREMGIGLYLFRPVLYTDMSEAWLLGRRQRVITDLAGCYFGWIYLTALSAVALLFPAPSLLWAIVALSLGMLTNLNPFLRFDGYWVMTDALGVVNVHRRALRLLGYAVKRTLGLSPEPLDLPLLSPLAQRLLVALSVLYLVFTVGFLALGFRTLGQLFLDPVARRAFLAPFGAAISQGSVPGLFRALRSGGLMSVMVMYVVMLVISVLTGLASRVKMPLHWRSRAALAGSEEE